MTDEGRCPICQLEGCNMAKTLSVSDVECERCGTYRVTREAISDFKRAREQNSKDAQLIPYLCCFVRQSQQTGTEIQTIRTDNWREFAAAYASVGVSTKLRKLLLLIASRSKYPGDEIPILPSMDYPLIDAASESELKYFMNHAKEAGLVFLPSFQAVRLTVKGWETIEPVGSGGIPGLCFVAMSFDDSLTDVWIDGIEPAVREDCKMIPIRIDKQHHNEKICDKILAEIRRAQFVVADFTLHKAGVYFEAGFALGLDKPVIWLCREDELERSHFDTRQYNHISWKDPQDLRVKLTDRIRATILE